MVETILQEVANSHEKMVLPWLWTVLSNVSIASMKGVMIVDPGKNFEDLSIGELRPGYVFWMVGNDVATNLSKMVSRIVKEAKAPTIPPGSKGNTSAWKDENGGAMVRIVYTVNNENSHGTNTKYIRLTAKDIAELVTLQNVLDADVK